MFGVTAVRFSADDPLSGLELGEVPDATPYDDTWTTVTLKAAALNHHDLWSLRGVGLREEQLPMILGCDGAGIDDEGNEVVIHAVIPDPGWRGDETLDPKRSLLSERYPGTFAERVAVPRRNLVPRPTGLSWAEAACLPTAWLTAYRMLFTQSGVAPGGTVLVQGAGGGVATALVALGCAAGYRMWVTSRSERKLAAALMLGADAAFEPGTRLPERVDAVMETVGEATWPHSLRSLKQGGTVVVSGATSGPDPSADLRRMYFFQLRVVGSMMGTRDELDRLIRFCERTGVRPIIDAEFPLARARDAFAKLAGGETFGKIVLTA